MTNPLTIHMPEGKPFLEYEREFEFPVHAVFQAHVDPELYVQWIGTPEMTTRIDEFEPWRGGAFRWVSSDADGAEHPFRGLFHTVRADDFMLTTFEYEGLPDAVTLEYYTFTELPGGRSKLTGRSVYPSLEVREEFTSDGGMEQAMSESYGRLDGLLTKS